MLPMLVAYLESAKYVGHLFPLALLRIYLGWSFFTEAWQRYQGDYLSQPKIAAEITEWAPTSAARVIAGSVFTAFGRQAVSSASWPCGRRPPHPAAAREDGRPSALRERGRRFLVGPRNTTHSPALAAILMAPAGTPSRPNVNR